MESSWNQSDDEFNPDQYRSQHSKYIFLIDSLKRDLKFSLFQFAKFIQCCQKLLENYLAYD